MMPLMQPETLDQLASGGGAAPSGSRRRNRRMRQIIRALQEADSGLAAAERSGREAEPIGTAEAQKLRTVLLNLEQGVAMFDATEHLVFHNDRYCDVLGLPPEKVRPGMELRELIGRSLTRSHQDQRPGADVYAERHRFLARRQDGTFHQVMCSRTIAVRHRFLPDGGFVCTYEDLTEQLAVQEEILRRDMALKEANRRLDAALGNMTQGLVLFDREERLVVHNQRYLDLLGLPAERVYPGISLRELISLSAEQGNHPDISSEALYQRRRAFIARRDDRQDELVLRDGQVVAVRHGFLADGGWVATYEDITTTRRAEEALNETHRHFDAALAHMSQGLVLYDADLRVRVFNRRYCEISGLPPERVRIGMSLRELIEISVAMGNHGGETAEQVHADRMARLAGGRSSQRFDVRIADRFVTIRYEPVVGGGWVMTCEDITAQRQAEEQLYHLARHDVLTGLPNRLLLHERLDHVLEGGASGRSAAVLCLGLDRFKAVNEALGLAVGDALLRQVGERLNACMGRSDTVARLSGDEFAVVLPDLGRPEHAELLAESMLAMLSAPFEVERHQVTIGASIGIALAPTDGSDSARLLKSAEAALARSKGDRRGHWRFFEAEMDARQKARRTLELDLRQAMERREFLLHFQPSVETRSRRIMGFEALLRWRHPQRGMVSPAEFIPMAEETGLIVPLGVWVLHAACAEAATWPAPLRVAVNLSSVQFRGCDLAQEVAMALAETGLPATRLELEITETVMLQNDEATLTTLHRLRALGVQIAMDDFGTGYSSLSCLHSFPFDRIKLDQSFVRKLGHTAGSIAIVRAVTGLGRSLGIETTAEGVETEEQFARLRSENCSEVQGYLFSRPVPGSEIAGLITQMAVASAAAPGAAPRKARRS